MYGKERQPGRLNLGRAAVLAAGLALGFAGCTPAEATPVPRPSGTGITSLEIGKFQIINAKAGDIVLGDVAVGVPGTTTEQFKADAKNHNNPNIVELYDTKDHHKTGVNNENTGLITEMDVDGVVYVDDWKAALVLNLPEDKRQAFIDAKKLVMEKVSGCSDVCIDGVEVIPYTGPKTTSQGDLK